MLETWVFMTAFLGFCLIALFHGCVLLFAPDRYIPNHWDQPSLRLVRKPPLQLGKRFSGMCLTVMIVWIFLRPVVTWMLHPVKRELISNQSPLPEGMARWDMLGITLFAWVCGYFLFTRSKRSVELMFSADRSKLQDKTTFRLWMLEVQAAGLLFVVWSLIPMAEFIESLRN
jgi:hypothetical protein